MLTFDTSTPNNLLSRIKKLIDSGQIKTWAYDTDGDFTHTATQWNNKAWLRPHVNGSNLQFTILGPTSGLSTEVYAIYHGRFLEMMLAHFFNSFTVSNCTPTPTGKDSVVTAA